jgi:hypothetical protein
MGGVIRLAYSSHVVRDCSGYWLSGLMAALSWICAEEGSNGRIVEAAEA